MQNWFRLLRELFFQTKGQKARVTILRIFIMSTNYTNNSLNQEFCKFLAEPISLIICKLIFLSIILICSLVGNALIITVVSLRQELRKTINIFIVNMAVSDLIFPLVSIPFSLAGIATNSLQWPIRDLPGLISCKLSLFLTPVSVTVSVQSLLWIAMNRFVAVVLPLKANLISSRFRAFAIASTWVVAVLISSTDLYTTKFVQVGGNFYCIREDSLIHKTFGYGRVVLLTIAPLLLVTILYFAIAVTLRRQNKTLRCTAVKEHSQRKTKAIRMSLCIIVTFNLCTLVYTILTIASLQSEAANLSCFVNNVLWFLALLGMYLCSVVNPFICFTFVKSYRRGVREIFTCRNYGRGREDLENNKHGS